MKARQPDPLDPDQTGAWAQSDTFQQCANASCHCQPEQKLIDQGDIE